MPPSELPPKLPRLSPAVTDAICKMMLSDQGMLRPPDKASALLALICELYKTKEPFPPRKAVAKHIDASIATIDAALSTRLNEGYIIEAVDTVQGNVQRRNSVKRRKFYIPSKQLQDVVAKAKAWEARARRKEAKKLELELETELELEEPTPT